MPRTQLDYRNAYSKVLHSKTCSGPVFRPRVVHNSKLFQIEGVNWRLDYYKFKRLSCAEVLKLAIKNNKLKQSTAQTPISTSTSETKNMPASSHAKVMANSVKNIYHKVNKHKTKHMGTKPKVSPKNYCIPVFNRFQALQCVDDVTPLSSTNIHAVSEQTNAKRQPSSKMLKFQAICHDKHSLASEYDRNMTCLLESRTKMQVTKSYYLLVPY